MSVVVDANVIVALVIPLKQTVAYDAQYLALAEELGAECWTGDKRLVHAAGQAGLNWVHWLGEELDP